LEAPNDSPRGRSGDTSQLSGVEPDVCPAIGCIGNPSVSSKSFVGKLRNIPFPTIQMETSVLVLPPELLAQTVYVVRLVTSRGIPSKYPLVVLKLKPRGNSVELTAKLSTAPPSIVGWMLTSASLGTVNVPFP
jgi:hypothetical protein